MLHIVAVALLSSLVCAAIIHAGTIAVFDVARHRRMRLLAAVALFPAPFLALAGATVLLDGAAGTPLLLPGGIAAAILRWAFCAAVSIVVVDAFWDAGSHAGHP